jgi:hypothetical protein
MIASAVRDEEETTNKERFATFLQLSRKYPDGVKETRVLVVSRESAPAEFNRK